MKKTSILILLILLAFAPKAWAQFSGGTGTAEDPYLISSKDDWNTLHNQVKGGNLYTGEFFKMTADIGTVTTPISYTSDFDNRRGNYFEGTFDGDGHILTVNFVFNGKENIGVFSRLNNATIKNLHVKGKADLGEDVFCEHYGGIAGLTKGNTSIVACRSSVNIYSDGNVITQDGDDGEAYYLGGFVGTHEEGTLLIVNCLFDGKYKLGATNYVGGFVGQRKNGKISLVNCLSATKKFDDDFWSDHSSTFVSKGDGANVAMYHSIFTKKCGDDKDGVDARDWSPIEIMDYLGDTYWKPDVEDGNQVYLPRTNAEVSLSPYAFAGAGTEESPYLIQSANDWRGLTRDIYLWRTHDGEYFKLTNDIYLWETIEYEPSTMLGVTEKASFQGIFDGDGHTLTIDYNDNSSEHYCGPFRFINGATIKNLHMAGTIYKEKKKHVGGLVGKAYGTNHIINCRSSVDIQANTDGDGSHGGFLGDLRDGTTNFTSCVFDGKMQGPNQSQSRTKKWGGFVGWVADGEQANFTNCVFNPTLVNVKNDGNRTFARRDDGDDVTFTSCYYFQTLGSAQGKEACSISADEHVTMTPYGTEEPGITGGITSYFIFHEYNPCVMYGGVLYSGNGDQVKLNLSLNGEAVPDYSSDHFIANAGTINSSTNPRTLTMPNENVTISLAPTALGLCVGDMNDPYLIYTFEQWQQMCSRINNGESDSYHGGYYCEKYYKLMADITLSETHSSGNSAVMVGVSNNDHTKFSGTFDGNGYTLTLDIEDYSEDNYCAPFRYLKDGTIKNLHVKGIIYKTQAKNAGGLVGKAEGTNHIRNCRSSVDIHFNKDGDVSSGGFVGELRGSANTTNFYNCLFDGELRGTNAYCWGGFVGWVADGCWARFNNCLFNPADIKCDTTSGDTPSKTFARVHDNGHIAIQDCYYKTVINDAQGSTNATDYDNEQLRFNLGHGWEIVTEISVAKVVPIMKKYTLSGDGTEASPYLITSTDDWNGLAGNVYLGETYSNKFLQLTDNITVNCMIGTGTTSTTWDNYSFSGTFDGAGNTLTFDYSTNVGTEGLIAPFRFVDDATIKNLVVDGTIVTANKYAGGIIARVDGNTALTNCRSSVTINSNVAGEGCHGGLIGLIRGNNTATITGCIFDGKMITFNLGDVGATNHCGGLVGETFYDGVYTAHVSIVNSLYAPAELGEGEISVDAFYSSTLARYTNDNQATITNSYYMQALGTAQGKQARSITTGNYVTVDNTGTDTEYDVSGIISYGVGIMCDSVLYAGNGDIVSLNLSYTLPEGYDFQGYQVNAGALEGNDNDGYTLTMPDADVTITADAPLVTVYREILGYDDGTDRWAFIASPIAGSIAPSEVTNLIGAAIPESNPVVYDFDLYRLNPSNTTWENYHTHTSEFNLVNGMGYLYATKETKTLAFSGTLNTGAEQLTLTGLPAGFNLVGNPFTVNAYVSKPFYTLNGDGSAILTTQSTSAIPPCYGVIVEVNGSEAVTFNTTVPDQQNANNKGGLQIALTQANSRSNTRMDNAIVSFNEGSELGKFYFGQQDANIYIPQGGKECSIVYSDMRGEMPLNFKANKDDEYTLTFSSPLTFNYLHLIDNITGANVDLLQTPSYTFTGRTTDYASRFRLVFVANDANLGGEGSDDFAFISNGELIVLGEGTLQVFDVLGHQLYAKQVSTPHSSLLTSHFPAGVYLLRLITSDRERVQKIVVK